MREGGERREEGGRRKGGRREQWMECHSDKGKLEREAGTEVEEEGELTWVCDHSHGGTCREGDCTHSLTLQCLLINTRCHHHQQGHTDGGGVKGKGR